MRRSFRKAALFGAISALSAASCVSATKDANDQLKRGRDGDEMKVRYDLSLVVQSKDEGVRDRNIKAHPRNYKFNVAIAPLTIEFRRRERDRELGEPEENFSQRPPLSSPIDDHESRPQADLPPEDRLAGVPLRRAEDRFATAAPSSETPAGAEKPAPPSPGPSSPEKPSGEAPEKPAEKPPEKPAEKPPETLPPEKPAEKPPEKPAEKPPAKPDDDDEKPPRVGARPSPVKRIFADELAPPGSESAAEVTTAVQAAQARASDETLKKISQYEGMNFRIDANGFRKRVADIMNEYRVFERVDEIDYTSDQKTLDSLFQTAEANGDDFLLVATLKRNKVSYLGTDFGGAFLDDVLWVLFWVPSEFFGFIPRESYEADVELQVKLYDVRSRFAVVDRTFDGHDRLVLTGWERGYQIFGPFTVAMTGLYGHESLYATAGDWVRPGAWIDMERQLLDHFYNQLKKELDKTDAPTFEDSTNRGVREKPFALVCGISKYGKDAAPKLREWTAGTAEADAQAAKEKALGLAEGDLGTRPYAEADAKRVLELLHRRGALETAEGLTAANIDELLGEKATVVALRSAFRRLAKSRREDRVFVYLNGQTLVLDDAKQPDGTSKYFLPYGIDLGEVDKRRAAAAAAPDAPAPVDALKAYLDENAISFDWIDDCFNKSGPEDHVYLQSRHVLVLVDCAFPGACTKTLFCPQKAAQAQKGSTGAGEVVTTAFLDRLVAGNRGRTLVLTAAPGEEPLDVPDAKQGGFAFYFTQFLDTQNRVKSRKGAFRASDLVAYAADRIEAESRQVGRPQHVQVFGEKDTDQVVVTER